MTISPSALPAPEAPLHCAEEELERRVQERTAALVTANEALRKEIARVQRAGRAEELLRLAVEVASNGILMVGRDGAIALANAQLEKLFGYRKEELLGQAVEMLLPERYRASHAVDRAAFFAAPSARLLGADRDLYGLRKDGTEVPVEIGLQPLQTEAGAFVLATVIDVTERKRAEEERRDLLKEYRMMFDSVPALIWYKDRHNRILRVNAPAAASMGTSVADLEGQSTYDLYPDEAEKYHRDDLEVINAGRPKLGILERVVTASGEKLWVQTDKVPYRNERGEIIGVIVFSVDVTERQHAQEEVRKLNEELEQRVHERTAQLEASNTLLQLQIAERKRAEAEVARSNAELEQFAYVASHDLQEPLRKVQAFGNMLATACGPVLSEEGRDYLQRMQKAAGRMQLLINDLLSFARITRQARPFEEVDLTRMAREVVSDLEARIRDTKGRVDVEALPVLDADPTQMRQLLQNLIGNGLKYHRTEEPPVVRVQGRVLKNSAGVLASRAPGDDVCEIAVQDNGIGFDEKYLDRIFAPFQRLHGRGEYEGTGMGLAICRKIVERHGGAITARSAPGQGSTFLVVLPLLQRKGRERHE